MWSLYQSVRGKKELSQKVKLTYQLICVTRWRMQVIKLGGPVFHFIERDQLRFPEICLGRLPGGRDVPGMSHQSQDVL